MHSAALILDGMPLAIIAMSATAGLLALAGAAPMPPLELSR